MIRLTKAGQNILSVSVTPRSGRDILCGIEADLKGLPVLKVKVTAPPDGGKANAAVCKLIAKSARVPKTYVTVLRGHKSRHKQIMIKCDEEHYKKWLKSLL